MRVAHFGSTSRVFKSTGMKPSSQFIEVTDASMAMKYRRLIVIAGSADEESEILKRSEALIAEPLIDLILVEEGGDVFSVPLAS